MDPFTMSQKELAEYINKQSPGVFDTSIFNHEELVSVALSLVESEALQAEEAVSAASKEGASAAERASPIEKAIDSASNFNNSPLDADEEASDSKILLPSAEMVAEAQAGEGLNAPAMASTIKEDELSPLEDWQQELLNEFLEVCPSCTTATARHLLEASAFDMDTAMVMFMDNPTVEAPMPSAPTRGAGADAGANPHGFIPGVRPPLAPLSDPAAYPPLGMRMPGFGGGSHSDDDDDYSGVEEYDEFGVRRPDRVRHQRLHHSPRGPRMGSEYEEALARAEEEGVDWMFSPPASLNFVGSLEQCRDQGKVDGKWVLANLQDHSEFASHMLNRDTWSDETVEQVIRSNFVFWQRGSTSKAGKAFMEMYQLRGEDAKFPAILVIDPRTGAKVKGWAGYIEPLDMTQHLVGFLEKHSLSAHKIPITEDLRSRSRSQSMTGDQGEDVTEHVVTSEMVSNVPGEVANGTSNLIDGDCQTEEEPGQALEVDYGEAPVEPPAGPDTCRVQLKLPTGKTVVRRLLKSATLRNLYAVASGLDGVNGAPFELSTAFPAKKLDPSGGTVTEEQAAGAQVLLRLL